MAPSSRLHVADHVLLEEEAQVAGVQVLGQRRRQRQDVGGELPHLLRHLQLRDARRGSSARARRGGTAAPRRRRCGASTGRRRGRAAGRRRAGSRRRGRARSGAARRRRRESSSRSRPSRGAEDDEDPLDQLRLEARSPPSTSSTVTCSSGARGTALRRSRRRAVPRAGPLRSSSEWPRSRIRPPPAPGRRPPPSSGPASPARPSSSAQRLRVRPGRRSGGRPR